MKPKPKTQETKTMKKFKFELRKLSTETIEVEAFDLEDAIDEVKNIIEDQRFDEERALEEDEQGPLMISAYARSAKSNGKFENVFGMEIDALSRQALNEKPKEEKSWAELMTDLQAWIEEVWKLTENEEPYDISPFKLRDGVNVGMEASVEKDDDGNKLVYLDFMLIDPETRRRLWPDAVTSYSREDIMETARDLISISLEEDFPLEEDED